MTQLSKIQSLIFLAGGLFMVAGVGAFVFFWHREVACWVFLLGTLLFTSMQYLQRYTGNDITLKRLKRIQTLSGVLFVLAAIIMIDTQFKFLLPLFERLSSVGYIRYMELLYNKWVLPMFVGAILQVYTAHRISRELDKTKNT